MKIRQHEALRVPQGWNGQDKALVIQLERVLTDLYRLYGNAESAMVTDVAYDEDTHKLTVTIDGTTSDIVAVATLDGNGKIPANQLPSYVDDVEEYADAAHFPATGEEDKIYVAKDTGFTYRWSGTQYVRLNTYDPATQSASGLMSAADKTKLDGIATGANASTVDYDGTNKKITKTINGTTTDVVAVSSIKSALGSFTWGALAGR
jgi:hypothetical protein